MERAIATAIVEALGTAQPFQRQWHPTTAAAKMLNIGSKTLLRRRIDIPLRQGTHFREVPGGKGKQLEFHVERCRKLL
ncbi:MAG: hypothetical protein AAFY15_04535 [Cyanobacteria bacterium J06648_11]